MPELPEVETMVRGIRSHVVGRTIQRVVECATDCRPISITPDLSKIRKRLVGKQFQAVRRIGKRVILEVSDNSHLVIEPRMTGLVLLSDPPTTAHLRLQFDFLKSDIATAHEFNSLWFWDRRGLGTITLFDPGQLQDRFGPKVVGRDALEMTAADWSACCATSRREIKVLLLDQKAVAGIGNLYASEILHRAGIDPMVTAASLTSVRLKKLAKAVHDILHKAIEYEGSTLGDGTYRNALNQNGRYQNEHQVYMKTGETCPRCRLDVIERVVQAQRSTFFCRRCQR